MKGLLVYGFGRKATALMKFNIKKLLIRIYYNLMQLKILQNTPLPDILSAFNSAFANYFIPLEFTLEQLALKVQVDHIHWEYSVGAFDKGQLVGFILQGIGEHQGRWTAYNAGTGVLPAYRGQQLTQQLYQFAQPLLQQAGINYARLEVIKENKIAQTVYRKIGFEQLRLLNCYQQQKPLADSAPSRVQQSNGPLWQPPKTATDPTPTWQYAWHSIERYQQKVVQFSVQEQGKIIGAVVLYKNSGRILHLYIQPKHRRKGIGSLLLGRAAAFFAGLSCINVDASREDLSSFFTALGFENTLQQYEMGLVL